MSMKKVSVQQWQSVNIENKPEYSNIIKQWFPYLIIFCSACLVFILDFINFETTLWLEVILIIMCFNISSFFYTISNLTKAPHYSVDSFGIQNKIKFLYVNFCYYCNYCNVSLLITCIEEFLSLQTLFVCVAWLHCYRSVSFLSFL